MEEVLERRVAAFALASPMVTDLIVRIFSCTFCGAQDSVTIVSVSGGLRPWSRQCCCARKSDGAFLIIPVSDIKMNVFRCAVPNCSCANGGVEPLWRTTCQRGSSRSCVRRRRPSPSPSHMVCLHAGIVVPSIRTTERRTDSMRGAPPPRCRGLHQYGMWNFLASVLLPLVCSQV